MQNKLFIDNNDVYRSLDPVNDLFTEFLDRIVELEEQVEKLEAKNDELESQIE